MYLFFDTETTGLPRNWNAPLSDLENWPRLVQLAYLLFDENGIRLGGEDFIIKPEGYSIPPGVSKLHGITNEKALSEGKNLKEVLGNFRLQILSSDILVAHNMNFDEKIIGAEFLRSKMKNEFAGRKKICTMVSSVEFCKIKGTQGYKWPRLSELYFKLSGTEIKDAHNASTDVNTTAECFWKLRELGEI